MIYVVHIVKEIKPLSCNWMDYVSLKMENVKSFVLFGDLRIWIHFTAKHVLEESVNSQLSNLKSGTSHICTVFSFFPKKLCKCYFINSNTHCSYFLPSALCMCMVLNLCFFFVFAAEL